MPGMYVTAISVEPATFKPFPTGGWDKEHRDQTDEAEGKAEGFRRPAVAPPTGARTVSDEGRRKLFESAITHAV